MKIKPIIIVSGEPYSVFLEIFFKTLNNKKVKTYKTPILIGHGKDDDIVGDDVEFPDDSDGGEEEEEYDDVEFPDDDDDDEDEDAMDAMREAEGLTKPKKKK